MFSDRASSNHSFKTLDLDAVEVKRLSLVERCSVVGEAVLPRTTAATLTCLRSSPTTVGGSRGGSDLMMFETQSLQHGREGEKEGGGGGGRGG